MPEIKRAGGKPVNRDGFKSSRRKTQTDDGEQQKLIDRYLKEIEFKQELNSVPQ
ncbi:MAG: hypothetical protein MZV63_31695 [Marinilabiliales bacterium]|nr:hypothetical protein [Marinilabiliales bacterium]